MLAPLSFIRSLMFSTDVSYFKFLSRIHDLELSLRPQQLWDVLHPWFNIFVPTSSITTFDSLVFQQLVPVEVWRTCSRLSTQPKQVRQCELILVTILFSFKSHQVFCCFWAWELGLPPSFPCLQTTENPLDLPFTYTVF
jgi:hypothetical protein